MTQIAKLALEDGTVFTGNAFGADGEVDGEVVFKIILPHKTAPLHAEWFECPLLHERLQILSHDALDDFL